MSSSQRTWLFRGNWMNVSRAAAVTEVPVSTLHRWRRLGIISSTEMECCDSLGRSMGVVLAVNTDEIREVVAARQRLRGEPASE